MSDQIDSIAQEQAKAWRAASDRAQVRGESATSILFRNVAYELQYGSLTLNADGLDVQTKETTNA